MHIMNADQTQGIIPPPFLEDFLFFELQTLCELTGHELKEQVKGSGCYILPQPEFVEIEGLFMYGMDILTGKIDPLENIDDY